MTLRLNSTGGGHIEIDAPNTASNFSVTMPAAAGEIVVANASGDVDLGTGDLSAAAGTFAGNFQANVAGAGNEFRVTSGTSSVEFPVTGSMLQVNSIGGSVLSLNGGNGQNNVIQAFAGNIWYVTGTQPAPQFIMRDNGSFEIGAGAFTGNPAISLSGSGTITAPGTFSTTAPSPRSMFISAAGLMGGLSSVRASKKNINYEADYSWLVDLKPVAFNYRKTAEGEPGVYTEDSYDDLYYGLIAEDVESIAPAICNYDSDNNLQGIEYTKLITPILSQLQSALKRIEALEAKVAALEAG